MVIDTMPEDMRKEANYLFRKYYRTFGPVSCVTWEIGIENFKGLGLAIIVLDARKRDRICFRFLTRKKQNVIISASEARYLKKGHRIQRLCDEDVDTFNNFMHHILYGTDVDGGEGEEFWTIPHGILRSFFPRYWRRDTQIPDYSKLNFTR